MRSCTGRLCQYRYLSAFISLWLVYLRMIFSIDDLLHRFDDVDFLLEEAVDDIAEW